MKTNKTFLVLVGALFVGLSSCQSLHHKPKAMAEVRQLLFLSFHMQNTDTEGNVRYPNISFVGEEFYKVFLSAVQEGSKRVGFVLPRAAFFAEANINLREKVALDPNLVGAPWSFDATRFNPSEIDALLKAANCEAYLSLSLTASVWEQSIKGRITMTSRSMEVVWNQNIKEMSTYIIEDEASPYTTEMEQWFDDLENKKDHKEEVLQIYRELARQSAEALLDAMNEHLPAGAGGDS